MNQTRRFLISCVLLMTLALAIPLAQAASYQDWVHISGWNVTHYVSHVPNPCGSYDHACVYEMMQGTPASWYSSSHTIQFQVRFSANPNNIVTMDVYASGDLCSPYFAMSPTLITSATYSSGYWWYSPSNVVWDPQGYYSAGPPLMPVAKCNFEPRMWDNSNPTVFTNQIAWIGVGA